jgi:hypothetical protein
MRDENSLLPLTEKGRNCDSRNPFQGLSRWATPALFLLLSLSLVPEQTRVLAETCTALAPVGGTGTVVQKTVTPPSIPSLFGKFNNNNWNTDFVADSRAQYQRYLITLNPQDSGEYSIKVYLKYADNTADNFYNEKPKLSKDNDLVITATPRCHQNPYQVNVFVGDGISIGKSYQVSVQGCR